MLRENRFDLAQLDAKTSDLYLKIFAPFKANASVRQATSEIASSINSIFPFAHKRRARGFRVSPVAERNVFRFNSNLALNVSRLAGSIKQNDFSFIHGETYRHTIA